LGPVWVRVRVGAGSGWGSGLGLGCGDGHEGHPLVVRESGGDHAEEDDEDLERGTPAVCSQWSVVSSKWYGVYGVSSK
jgi:hypothetical protein